MTGGCVLCGADSHTPCPPQCAASQWPPPPRKDTLRRALIGLFSFFLLTAMVAPKYGWQHGLFLAGVLCGLFYVLLRAADVPAEVAGKVTGRSRDRGFTLIELLIVLAIIGIIASIAIPSLLHARQGQRSPSVEYIGGSVGKVCDAGNLVYFRGDGLAVVPGGCVR